MKKTLLLLTLCAVLVLSCACSNINTTDGETVSPTGQNGEIQSPDAERISEGTVTLDTGSVQYIRTVRHCDDCEYPHTVVIRSQQELYDYYTENKYDYGLWNDWHSSVSFINAAEKYDSAFFEDNALLLVLMLEGSGSYRHHATDISEQDGTVTVNVERLTPGIFTDDMAMWHIIIEQPKGDLEGCEIAVNVKDVPMGERVPYERPEHKVIVTSCEVTVAPVEQMQWSEQYDPKTGECSTTEYDQAPMEQHTDLIPELTVGRDLIMQFPMNYRMDVNEFVLCDEQWNVLETLDELNAGVLMRQGEGAYYVRMDVQWQEDYVDIVQKHNSSRERYYIKLILPEEEYGLAKQLEELGNFDITALQKTEVYMINSAKDGGIEPTSISNGTKGLERLLSLMRSTETQEAHLVPASAGWSQVIRLYDDESRIMTIKAGNDGLYISTDGKHYTISAPPWLFEQMVQSIANTRILPMEEVTAYVWETVKQRKEYGLFADGSETKTIARLAADYPYEWVVTYHIKYDNGETKKLTITIENHNITRFNKSE